MRIASLLAICLAAAGPAAAGPAATGSYPERPVTIVSAFPAGGIVDVIARRLARGADIASM